jgi:asparagine synthase (glutamine-hydrolysing)
VPVGAYLSGGLDSTAVVALIRNFTSSRLETFSISFEDLAYDEGGFQDQVSKAFGTANHKIRCSYKDIRDAFPEVIWHAEKPILRTAPAPLYLLSRLVREKGLKVVLTGEGADEVMGGYDIFRETKIREFWAREPLSKARPLLLKRLYPYLPRLQGSSRQYMEAFFGTGIEARDDVFFSHRPRWATTAKTKVFFSNDLRHRLDGGGPEKRLLMSLRKDIGGLDPVQRAEYLEIKNLLPGYILSSQGDRVSMAHSIEGRFPFLDHRVAELTARLPGRYKIRGLDEKHILKTSMKALLPESIIKRKKQPYLAPEARSFFEGGRPCEYAAWLLSAQCITRYGYFDPKAVSMLLDKCMAGRAAGFRDNMAFVGILSTQMLHRLFIEDFRQEQGRLKNLHIINGEENASRQGV